MAQSKIKPIIVHIALVEETKRTNALDDSELESDDEMLTTAMYGQKRSKWLPRLLNLLFEGQKVTDSEKQMQ